MPPCLRNFFSAAETPRLSSDPRPIGVFDSGVGGLTVVRRLFELLPRESVSYFGDTARLPYGSKTRPTIIQFSIENTRWLVEQGVKAVVVACNTSTALALPELQKKFDLPVIGVIEPGARAAARLTRSGRIGVIATRATALSRAYSRALAGISKKLIVTERSCPLFVPLVEEGWLDHAATREVAREYLAPLVRRKVDTLVLGCTHYPLIRDVIQEVMGPNVRLIDSGEEAAAEARQVLRKSGALAGPRARARHEYALSDLPGRFTEVGSRFLGRPLRHVRRVRHEDGAWKP